VAVALRREAVCGLVTAQGAEPPLVRVMDAVGGQLLLIAGHDPDTAIQTLADAVRSSGRHRSRFVFDDDVAAMVATWLVTADPARAAASWQHLLTALTTPAGALASVGAPPSGGALRDMWGRDQTRDLFPDNLIGWITDTLTEQTEPAAEQSPARPAGGLRCQLRSVLTPYLLSWTDTTDLPLLRSRLPALALAGEPAGRAEADWLCLLGDRVYDRDDTPTAYERYHLAAQRGSTLAGQRAQLIEAHRGQHALASGDIAHAWLWLDRADQRGTVPRIRYLATIAGLLADQLPPADARATFTDLAGPNVVDGRLVGDGFAGGEVPRADALFWKTIAISCLARRRKHLKVPARLLASRADTARVQAALFDIEHLVGQIQAAAEAGETIEVTRRELLRFWAPPGTPPPLPNPPLTMPASDPMHSCSADQPSGAASSPAADSTRHHISMERP
jgi:hypothetical protein